MSKASEKMPALEWFFKRGSVANFPQDTLDVNYSQLRKASAELEKALVETGLSAKYPTVNIEKELNAENLDTFIEKLKVLSDMAPSNNGNNVEIKQEEYKAVLPKINNALVSLVMFAKASKDTYFREKVLNLINHLS